MWQPAKSKRCLPATRRNDTNARSGTARSAMKAAPVQRKIPKRLVAAAVVAGTAPIVVALGLAYPLPAAVVSGFAAGLGELAPLTRAVTTGCLLGGDWQA